MVKGFKYEVIWEKTYPFEKYRELELFDRYILTDEKRATIQDILSNKTINYRQIRGKIAEKVIEKEFFKGFKMFVTNKEQRVGGSRVYNSDYNDIKNLILILLAETEESIKIRNFEETRKSNIKNVLKNPDKWPSYLSIKCTIENCKGYLDFYSEDKQKLRCDKCSNTVNFDTIKEEQVLKCERGLSITGEGDAFYYVRGGFLKPNQMKLEIWHKNITDLILELVFKKWKKIEKEKLKDYEKISGKDFVEISIDDVIQSISEEGKILEGMFRQLLKYKTIKISTKTLETILPKEFYNNLLAKHYSFFNIYEWLMDYWFISGNNSEFDFIKDNTMYFVESKSYLMESCEEHTTKPKFALNIKQREYIAELYLSDLPVDVLVITVGFCQCHKFFIKIIKPKIANKPELKIYFENKKKKEIEVYNKYIEKLEQVKKTLPKYGWLDLIPHIENMQHDLKEMIMWIVGEITEPKFIYV